MISPDRALSALCIHFYVVVFYFALLHYRMKARERDSKTHRYIIGYMETMQKQNTQHLSGGRVG